MKKSIGVKPVAYPTPVWIVGTYDREGKPNGMTAAWGGICCSKPPCVCVSLQKVRHSYQPVLENQCFTISIPSEAHVAAADYFGIASGKNRNKFDDTGLTPVRGEFVNAPYVDEFPMVLECKLVQTHELGLHTQFVGEIVNIQVDEDCLNENGKPDILKIKPIIFAPETVSYHSVGPAIGPAFSIGKTVMKK